MEFSSGETGFRDGKGGVELGGYGTDTAVELEDTGKLIARTHPIVFLPAVAIALIYGGVWLLLDQLGRGDSGLARLCFLIGVVVPPIFIVSLSGDGLFIP